MHDEPIPSASVVICCYSDGRFADVVAAVRSIQAQVPSAPEAVVVVDHNPALRSRLEAVLPRTHLIENKGPRGLSGARNAGIAATRGEIVVFLDDDAVAAPEMVLRMAEASCDPAVLGVAGRIVPRWDGGAPSWFPDEFLWVVGCTYAGHPSGTVRNPIGAAMAVRRSVFATVGGFDTRMGRTHAALPLGCEETELAIRAGKAIPGGRFVHVPEASCLHRVPDGRGTWGYLATRCWAEGTSKAVLSRVVGTGQALSSERAYVRSVLPAGIASGLRRALRGDAAGIGRAAAIVVGFSFTAAAYAAGRAGQALSRGPGSAAVPAPERLS
ncbi:glycosyltransferase [Methylobacterium sp. E-016]|uniref:glycosyltransferase family 2 protein n=1 Tax=Methylobacterium sp. E-016 TaxID=2836556 RepID=UPI001FB9EA1A|nr:glycosyltransferase [Methylobacterium sp. E-016]MCJ2076358.1 glycosyltransferase [Methylobacterium sp. E-016]